MNVEVDVELMKNLAFLGRLPGADRRCWCTFRSIDDATQRRFVARFLPVMRST